MKKNLLYILILVALIGIFNPIEKAGAEDPKGTCVTNKHTYVNVTKISCDQVAQGTGETVVSWKINCTAPKVSSESGNECVDPAPPNTTYTLLAPLPCPAGSLSCPGGMLTTYEVGADKQLSRYLNTGLTIFIGICAVLAMIQLTIAGAEYMTSELVSSKESAKTRGLRAIGGLTLALIAWPILHQINPDLLKADPESSESFQAATLTIEIMDEAEIFATALDGDSPFTSGMVTPHCPEGIIRTTSGAPACKRIASKFDEMIVAARAAGINISGYGYRNIANQTQLRIAHCHGDTTNPRPQPPCNPLTALPGASNHNHGLAFDLRCTEGGGASKKIAARDNVCFLWLNANAYKYNLYNLPIEPWHWSVDGK